MTPLSLLFVLFGIWHALAGRATDLVEWRRQLRVEFAVCTALYIVLIIVSQWLWPGILGKRSVQPHQCDRPGRAACFLFCVCALDQADRLALDVAASRPGADRARTIAGHVPPATGRTPPCSRPFAG